MIDTFVCEIALKCDRNQYMAKRILYNQSMENDISLNGSESYPIKRVITGNDLVKLYLEEDKISVSIEDYFKYELGKRSSLDSDTYQILKNNEKILKAYQSCLRKLSLKDHTVKQIRDHLFKKEIEKEDIDDIIEKLLSYDLLDDEKYCQNKITYYDNENLSYHQIRQKLKTDGVSDDIIGRYLVLNEKKERQKIDKLVGKYSRSIRNKSHNNVKNAIISKLVNSGFPFSDCKEAAGQLLKDEKNEIKLLEKEYQKARIRYGKKYEGYDLNRKIMQSLVQKGFAYDDIRNRMEDGYDEESDRL